MTVEVSLEEIEKYLEFRRLVNTTPLEDIRWTRGGEHIEANAKDIEEWLYVGLNNIHFAEDFLLK